MIKKRKTKALKQILEDERDPWGKVYRLVRNKKAESQVLKTIKKEDGNWTVNADDTVEYPVRKYFVIMDIWECDVRDVRETHIQREGEAQLDGKV